MCYIGVIFLLSLNQIAAHASPLLLLSLSYSCARGQTPLLCIMYCDCLRCMNVNWETRNKCNVCGTAKSAPTENRTGLGGGFNERQGRYITHYPALLQYPGRWCTGRAHTAAMPLAVCHDYSAPSRHSTAPCRLLSCVIFDRISSCPRPHIHLPSLPPSAALTAPLTTAPLA